MASSRHPPDAAAQPSISSEQEELRQVVGALRTHLHWRLIRGHSLAPASPTPRIGPPPTVHATPPAAEPSDSPVRLSGDLPDVISPGAEGLRQIREALGDCKRCRLARGRIQLVFGQGNPEAELMFVGEGPGRDEDLAGLAFVGAAGELLTKMIQAMGYSRDEVYIGNVIKCRPPSNRDPEPDETATCEPFLWAQIEAIRPRIVVTLGRYAAHTLLRTETAISRLRGSFHTIRVGQREISVMPTYHPAYLLRNAQAKRPVWEDLKQVMAHLANRGGQP